MQRDSRIPSIDEEDFHSFVRHIGHTTKRKGIEVESDSEGEDDAEDHKDQENLEDDDVEGEDDEDDHGQRYIKEENLKVQYPPLQGNERNSHLAMHVLGETTYVTCRIQPKCEGRVMNVEE